MPGFGPLLLHMVCGHTHETRVNSYDQARELQRDDWIGITVHCILCDSKQKVNSIEAGTVRQGLCNI